MSARLFNTTTTLRRGIAVFALGLSFAAVLPASEFDWFVREFARQSGARPTCIPLFGLVRFSVAVVHPAGATELRLALFEHANLEPARFAQLTDTVWGATWKPIVRVRDRNGEVTNIYVQQSEKHLRVLVTSLDGEEATFVQVRIKPEQLIKFIDEQRCNKHKTM
jgi:hypothetical protein